MKRKGSRLVARGRLVLRRKSRCSGEVSIRVKQRRQTISSRFARLHKGCRYRLAVAFADLPSRGVRVKARYFGNRAVKPLTARVVRVR